MRNLKVADLEKLTSAEIKEIVTFCESGRYVKTEDFAYTVRRGGSGFDTTHLQYVGDVIGKDAIEFKCGERMIWNTGGDSMFYGIEKATAKFIEIIEIWISDFNGEYKVSTRRVKKERILACYTKDLSETKRTELSITKN